MICSTSEIVFYIHIHRPNIVLWLTGSGPVISGGATELFETAAVPAGREPPTAGDTRATETTTSP